MSNNYNSRPSTLHPDLYIGAPPPSQYTPSMMRLLDKQREYEAFLKVFGQGEQLVSFFEQFGDKYDVLDGGSEGALTCCWLWVPGVAS
jgi:hypothetical protein